MSEPDRFPPRTPAAARSGRAGAAGVPVDPVTVEQLRAHYAQLPAMTAAPSLGGLYTLWVLWNAVDRRWWLALGLAIVWGLSAWRLWLWQRFRHASAEAQAAPRWRHSAVAAALVSGCVWGSMAPLLYPPAAPDYDVYLVVLLTLLPIVPVAALAAYMPAFYAYFVPCMAPFVLTLALRESRAERFTALLLAMMLGAMVGFARRYSATLAEAVRLRLALDERSRALQAAIEQKSRLMSAAGHDLSQPVHAMGLRLEALRHQALPREARETVGSIADSLRGLRAMLGHLLEVSRLEARTVTTHRRTVDVQQLLYRVSDECSPMALERGLVLRCHTPAEAWADCDPLQLERMLRNLVFNALRFTRTGGVLLACRRRGDRVLLQVFDTGIGIAPEHQERIFEPFVRVAPDGEAAGDGDHLGLGLAIVRGLAALQGITVTLRSRPGRGSSFTLALVDVAPPAPVADAGAPTAPQAPPGCVMLIDDDAAVAAAVADLLPAWGHRPVVCRDADAALRHLDGGGARPDVLLVDWRLAGGRNGLDAAQRVRERLGRPLPVILITGDGAPDSLRAALASGCPLLYKPVDPQRLRECIDQARLAAADAALGGRAA